MKRSTFLTLLFVIALFFLFPAAANAATVAVGGNTYDQDEYNQLSAFLSAPSSVSGQSNADQLGYDINDPISWDTMHNRWTVQDGVQRLAAADWRSKNLAGILDVSSFDYLETLRCDSNAITGIIVTNDTELTQLTCSHTSITELNLGTNSKLEWLDCHNTTLSTLDTSAAGVNLSELDCTNCGITSLTFSGNTQLLTLWCGLNNLSDLDVSGFTSLSYLACNHNGLDSLDVTGCTGLNNLECNNNNLTELDLSGCNAITDLRCQQNGLTELNITNQTGLVTLYCSENDLTALNITNQATLFSLDCSGNDITMITGLSGKPLMGLYCSDNPLNILDVSGLAGLVSLECDNCGLSALDITSNNNLTTLSCSGNLLSALDVSSISNFYEFDCTGNPLTSLQAVLNGNNVELTASGSGYATLYFHDGMRVFLPDGYYAQATPASGMALRDWTDSSDAIVSTNVKYYLNGDNAYDLTANFEAASTSGSSHTSSPTVRSGAVSDITFSSATLTGNVLSGGGATVTERGFVYSTNPNPQLDCAGVLSVTADGRVGSFSVTLTDLTPGTTYYARPYVVNSKGVAYGTTIQFETTAIIDAASVPKTGDAGMFPVAWILCVAAIAAMTLLIEGKRRFLE